MSAVTDALSDFSRKPLPIRLGGVLGVVAVIGLIYYQLAYSSMAEEYDSEVTRHERLKKSRKSEEQKNKKLDEYLKKNEEMRETLRKNNRALPTQAELPAFFSELQKKAAASGVSVVTWKRVKEKPVGLYVKVPVQMKVTGTFYQLNHYFKMLNDTDRIISVENLKLGNAQTRNDETFLVAEFTASTFRMKESNDVLFTIDEDDNDGKAKAAKAKKSKGQPTKSSEAKPKQPEVKK